MAASGAALLGVTSAQLAAPAVASTKYPFAYGAGKFSRSWQDSLSSLDGGACLISADDYMAQQAPQTNQIDGVVLPVSALPVVNGTVHVAWGVGVDATAQQLLIRFIHIPGCALTGSATLAKGQSKDVPLPANTAYMIVSATEGTVQPWFTLG
jgi:hypothetical protein